MDSRLKILIAQEITRDTVTIMERMAEEHDLLDVSKLVDLDGPFRARLESDLMEMIREALDEQ